MSEPRDLEKVLREEGELFDAAKGRSMLPLVHEGSDVLHIKKIEKPLKKGDVILYVSKDGKYVLHRLLKAKKDGTLLLAGDHNRFTDRPISHSQAIGILVAVIHSDGSSLKMEEESKGRKFFYTRLYPLKNFLFFFRDGFLSLKGHLRKKGR